MGLSEIRFASFLPSFATSFLATLISEIGDRTFLVTAILASRLSKLCCVFSAALTALIVQTFILVCLGRLLHLLSSNIAVKNIIALPIDDYAAACMLFIFGFLFLRAGFKHEPPSSSSYQLLQCDAEPPSSVDSPAKEQTLLPSAGKEQTNGDFCLSLYKLVIHLAVWLSESVRLML